MGSEAVSGMWDKGIYHVSAYTDGRVTGPWGYMPVSFNETPEINAKVVTLLNHAYEQGKEAMRDQFRELLGIPDSTSTDED